MNTDKMHTAKQLNLFDSHAHLDHRRFSGDLEQVLERAREASVVSVLAVSFSPDPVKLESPARLSERNPMVWATAGVHPHEASKVTDESLQSTVRLTTTHPRVVAVGEIGLDYHYNYSPPKVQRRCFRDFLHLAREVDRPVVVHVRDAYDDAIRMLADADIGRVSGVIHCFSGDRHHARAFLEMGLYLSFTGILTFPQADGLREVAAEVPLDRILVETDSPYLAPEPHRGKRAEPAHVALTNRRLAELKGLDEFETAEATFNNTRTLFGIRDLEDRIGTVVYTVGDSVYLNLTNRCNLECRFCPKRVGSTVLGYDLELEREPVLADVLEGLSSLDLEDFEEVVFCGLGEPTLRLSLMKELAPELRRRGARRIRLNTDGLASLVWDRDVPAELDGLIDSVSVSLNAPDEEMYGRLCPSKHGRRAYEAVKGFVRSAKRNLPHVRVTVVGVSGLDIEACRRVASELNVPFKVR